MKYYLDRTYPMPDGPHYCEMCKLRRQLQKDPRYQRARSCKHCTDTADSFNRYVSTYCHIRQENIAGMDEDMLDRCMTCEMYERRTHEN